MGTNSKSSSKKPKTENPSDELKITFTVSFVENIKKENSLKLLLMKKTVIINPQFSFLRKRFILEKIAQNCNLKSEFNSLLSL
jgi:hypothetical protein